MSLMVSVSGIRGIVSEGLTPQVIVDFTSAYGAWVLKQFPTHKKPTVVLGRDTRITGKMVSELVSSTLNWCGISVIELGVVPTPTVQVAVENFQAQGGIIVSASHNPAQWNALKLLNHTGEFMTPEEGAELLDIKTNSIFSFAPWNKSGTYEKVRKYHRQHIETLLNFPFVDYKAIKNRKLKVVVDAVEGAGYLALPELLEKLGCEVIRINCEGTGLFPHPPEPLAHHLTDLMLKVKDEKADIGFATDPDADRLAVVTELGDYMGEEYTITACTDFMLSKKKGDVVVNLSTTRAVADVAQRYGHQCHMSKVGEINVVKMMQEKNAVIGGEGSGGVILPDAHYGRDSLVGVLLIVAYVCEHNETLSSLRKKLPIYEMAKHKVDLGTFAPDTIIHEIIQRYQTEKIDQRDGLKIDFPDCWVHLRKSNTEPIIRIYTEAKSQTVATNLAEKFVKEIKELMV